MREPDFFELIKNKRFAPGPGVAEPAPEKGIKRFLFLLAAHFWKLVSLNLLFLLFSIPVVTMPAALCGMNRVLIKLVREGNCFLWSDFIKEFRAELFKSLPFGILYAFLLFDSYYAFSWSISGENGLELLPAAVGFFLFGTAAVFFGYVFVFLPTLALKNRYIARNAFIIMLTEWKTSLVILGSTLAMSFFAAAFLPYTVFFLLFIGFSLSQLIVCTAVNEPLQRRIIEPYEQERKAGL